jgi:hypothetical protein
MDALEILAGSLAVAVVLAPWILYLTFSLRERRTREAADRLLRVR